MLQGYKRLRADVPLLGLLVGYRCPFVASPRARISLLPGALSERLARQGEYGLGPALVLLSISSFFNTVRLCLIELYKLAVTLPVFWSNFDPS